MNSDTEPGTTRLGLRVLKSTVDTDSNTERDGQSPGNTTLSLAPPQIGPPQRDRHPLEGGVRTGRTDTRDSAAVRVRAPIETETTPLPPVLNNLRRLRRLMSVWSETTKITLGPHLVRNGVLAARGQ